MSVGIRFERSLSRPYNEDDAWKYDSTKIYPEGYEPETERPFFGNKGIFKNITFPFNTTETLKEVGKATTFPIRRIYAGLPSRHFEAITTNERTDGTDNDDEDYDEDDHHPVIVHWAVKIHIHWGLADMSTAYSSRRDEHVFVIPNVHCTNEWHWGLLEANEHKASFPEKQPGLKYEQEHFIMKPNVAPKITWEPQMEYNIISHLRENIVTELEHYSLGAEGNIGEISSLKTHMVHCFQKPKHFTKHWGVFAFHDLCFEDIPDSTIQLLKCKNNIKHKGLVDIDGDIKIDDALEEIEDEAGDLSDEDLIPEVADEIYTMSSLKCHMAVGYPPPPVYRSKKSGLTKKEMQYFRRPGVYNDPEIYFMSSLKSHMVTGFPSPPPPSVDVNKLSSLQSHMVLSYKKSQAKSVKRKQKEPQQSNVHWGLLTYISNDEESDVPDEVDDTLPTTIQQHWGQTNIDSHKSDNIFNVLSTEKYFKHQTSHWGLPQLLESSKPPEIPHAKSLHWGLCI